MGGEEPRIRIAGAQDDSIVDGRGVRYAVFAQGCPHRCPGCHNPETHDPEGGRWEAVGALLESMAVNPLLDGLTLSGGEPFSQAGACAALARGARSLGLNVWVYSGYAFEELIGMGPEARALLDVCDVLVDGPFVLSERTLEAPFVGSRNQRILDLPASLRAGAAVPLG